MILCASASGLMLSNRMIHESVSSGTQEKWLLTQVCTQKKKKNRFKTAVM